MTDEEYLDWLQTECGYDVPILLPGGRYACLNIRPYNVQIITGKVGDMAGYDTAW